MHLVGVILIAMWEHICWNVNAQFQLRQTSQREFNQNENWVLIQLENVYLIFNQNSVSKLNLNEKHQCHLQYTFKTELSSYVHLSFAIWYVFSSCILKSKAKSTFSTNSLKLKLYSIAFVFSFIHFNVTL